MEKKTKGILAKEYRTNYSSTNVLNEAQYKIPFSTRAMKFNIYGENEPKIQGKFSGESNSKKNLFRAYFIFFLALLILPQLHCTKKFGLKQLNYDNYIVITIVGYEKKKIISTDASWDIMPNKIKINEQDEITSDIQKEYYLLQETNTIRMTWNHQLTSCHNLFKQVPHIQSIDLSHFDCSYKV